MCARVFAREYLRVSISVSVFAREYVHESRCMCARVCVCAREYLGVSVLREYLRGSICG